MHVDRTFHRGVVLGSLRDTRGSSVRICVRHLVHLVRIFNCCTFERIIRGLCSLPPAPSLGPKKSGDFCAALSSCRTVRYPGGRKAGLQQNAWHFILFHCCLLTIVGNVEWQSLHRGRSSFLLLRRSRRPLALRRGPRSKAVGRCSVVSKTPNWERLLVHLLQSR